MTSAFPTVYHRGASMPADTAKQETWLDWWPDDEVIPEELLTRQRFVDRLRGEGVEVTVFDLMNWEKRGITPRPTRQRVGRTTHAMYHPRVLEVIRTLRELQAEGRSLADIGRELRGRFPNRRQFTIHASTAMAFAAAGAATI